MSILAQMFGKKGAKAPSPQEAIQRLRETEEMLQKKSDFLEKKIEQEIGTARKHGTKNKRGDRFWNSSDNLHISLNQSISNLPEHYLHCYKSFNKGHKIQKHTYKK